MPLIAAAAIAAGGAITTGIIGHHAATSAANTQAAAANNAAKLAADTGAQSLQLQRDSMNQQQQNIQPWLDAGQQGLLGLKDFLSQNNDWNQTFTADKFKAPAAFDPNSVQLDPGFEKRLEAGNRVLTSGFASRGNLGNGRAAEALAKSNQEQTSDEFSNAYNRTYGAYKDNYNNAYTQFSDDYNRSLNEYQQQYNIFSNNKANKFNRLAALSGVGQQAATGLNTNIGIGTNNLTNISQNTANNIGALGQQAAAANAAGQVGGANSINNALQNVVNQVSGVITTRDLLKSQRGGQQLGAEDI